MPLPRRILESLPLTGAAALLAQPGETGEIRPVTITHTTPKTGDTMPNADAQTQTEFDTDLRTDLIERLELTQDADTEEWAMNTDEPYPGDVLSEIADSAVPVYTRERVQLWLNLGLPEVDDPGLIEGVTAVEQIIAVAIYEYATQELYRLAREEFDLDL